MYNLQLQLKRVDLDRSLAKKKYLPPSSNFEKPPDEKQLCFLCGLIAFRDFQIDLCKKVVSGTYDGLALNGKQGLHLRH